MGNIPIVGDHDDGIFCLAVEGIEDIHDALCIPLIEVSRGFIGEEVGYIRDKGSRDSHTLLLSSREFIRISFSLSRESDFFEDVRGRISTRSMRNIEHEIDILFDREVRNQLKCLKNKGNMSTTKTNNLIGFESGNIGFSESH